MCNSLDIALAWASFSKWIQQLDTSCVESLDFLGTPVRDACIHVLVTADFIAETKLGDYSRRT